MYKDAPSSVALICFLLAIIVSTTYFKAQVNQGKDNFLQSAIADFSHGLWGGENAQIKTPNTLAEIADSSENQLDTDEQNYADPTSYVAAQIKKKFASEFKEKDLTDGIFVNDVMWWRSDKEQYRLRLPNAKTYGVQLVTNQVDTPDNINPGVTPHPASKNRTLGKISKEIAKLMVNLGYKQSEFATCPVSEAYDPYNNCVAIFVRHETRCSLIAGFGRIDKQADLLAYQRLELSCSPSYAPAYQQTAPFLHSLNLTNPAWKVPDMTVYNVSQDGDWFRVEFGAMVGLYHQTLSGIELVAGGSEPFSCAQMERSSIPESIYHHCL